MSTMMRELSTQERSWPLSELPASVVDLETAAMPTWLRDIRSSAMARFQSRGLPKSTDEAWRLTNLRAIRETQFAMAGLPEQMLNAAEVDHLSLSVGDAVRLVFVNGKYIESLSDARRLPKGVKVSTLREAMLHEALFLKTHLAQYASDEYDPFVTLNTALLDDGLVLHVEKNVKVDRPIYLLCVTSAPDGPVITHPRNLIVTEEGSSATIIEDYVGLDETEKYFTNAVTELVVGAKAEVHHYMIERDSAPAFNISTLTAWQGERSKLSSHSVLIGGSLVRNNVNPVLNGEHCHSLLNGLYVGRDAQHLDNNMRVEHRKANCDSRQYYKGILNDESHGVFTGRIIVSREAQKTDAVQSNQNLLLSRNARANTKPQLEIYADDVKCTHGATIGELDEKAVFYLRSRGLNDAAARGILVQAIANESLDRMDIVPLREQLQQMIAAKLPFGGN